MIPVPEVSDPLHAHATDPDVMWSPGNVGEAVPGVSTALNWTFAGEAIERGNREALGRIGALSRAEVPAPAGPAEDRFLVAFFGRTVANIDALRGIGDRLPGASGSGIERQLFGVVRDDVEDRPTRDRWPAVATRLPRVAAALGRDSRRARAGTVAWWRSAALGPPDDHASAVALLVEARERYVHVFGLGAIAAMLASGVYDQLRALSDEAGLPGHERRLVTGYGGMVENALVDDLWRLGRGAVDLQTVLLRHGYHGPNEGQMASTSWREDAAPVRALAARYAALGPERAPDAAGRRQAEGRELAEAELLAALGRGSRAKARAVMGLTRGLVPLREIAKANYTQCLDGGRLAARVLGGLLADDGRLDDREDVFHLTFDELTGADAALDLRAVAASRRATREAYCAMPDLPDHWTGPPAGAAAPGGAPADASPERADPGTAGSGDVVVTGEAIGCGSVTGRVRVVVDPDDDDLEPDEILVCRNTDPGWAPVFHLASGVVTDLGGALSHGAIVARELGLPCVTGTRNGTTALRTGDLVRVDGDAGRVEVLRPAENEETTA